MQNLTIELIRGGDRNLQEARKKVSRKPHVIIATPGRALQLIKEKYLHCENMLITCLDEADKMLADFYNDIREIFSMLPPTIQLLLFSATIPHPIFLDLLKKYQVLSYY